MSQGDWLGFPECRPQGCVCVCISVCVVRSMSGTDTGARRGQSQSELISPHSSVNFPFARSSSKSLPVPREDTWAQKGPDFTGATAHLRKGLTPAQEQRPAPGQGAGRTCRARLIFDLGFPSCQSSFLYEDRDSGCRAVGKGVGQESLRVQRP